MFLLKPYMNSVSTHTQEQEYMLATFSGTGAIKALTARCAGPFCQTLAVDMSQHCYGVSKQRKHSCCID